MVSFLGITKTSILKAVKECDQLGRESFRDMYGFGPSTIYPLVYRGKEYDSKAILGVAYAYSHPGEKPLNGGDFGGGKSRVLPVFKRLGFEITKKEGRAGESWTPPEIAAVVKAYFEMLEHELAGRKYVKADYNRRIRETAKSRSKAAVELKLQNVSAELDELGLPWIDGYKPRSHGQGLLRDAIQSWVQKPADRFFDEATRRVKPSAADLKRVFTDPPKRGATRGTGAPRSPVITDWERRETISRKLGKNGEEYVRDLERLKLHAAGKSDLAKKIEWVSQTRGDGDGYDIASFDPDGTEILIEVKTTRCGKSQPFPISPNEVKVSKRKGKAYRLYRVYDFPKDPRIYVLEGSIEKACDLKPLSFSASPRC